MEAAGSGRGDQGPCLLTGQGRPGHLRAAGQQRPRVCLLPVTLLFRNPQVKLRSSSLGPWKLILQGRRVLRAERREKEGSRATQRKRTDTSVCPYGFPALLGIRHIQSLWAPDSDRTPRTLVKQEEMR